MVSGGRGGSPGFREAVRERYTLSGRGSLVEFDWEEDALRA